MWLPLIAWCTVLCFTTTSTLNCKFASQGKNLTPRGQHAAALFLMTAINLARNLHLDAHRTAIWLSVVWQCFQLVSYYRTRDHIHLDRYFEETLIRHCVNFSPLGCEVFSEDEARILQRFFCRFTRLLPLLQLYLFKVFDIEFRLSGKRPYLRGKDCTSEMNLNFIDTMADPLLRMDMYNRPKRNKDGSELFKCSMAFFRKLWRGEGNENQPFITKTVVDEFLGIVGSKNKVTQ